MVTSARSEQKAKCVEVVHTSGLGYYNYGRYVSRIWRHMNINFNEYKLRCGDFDVSAELS